MRKVSLIIFFCTLNFLSSLAESNILNRNLLDVGKAIYTHRDFLIWNLATESLFMRNRSVLNLPNETNWNELTEDYLLHMIINHHINSDSDRNSSFFPSTSMITKSYQIAKGNIEKKPALRTLMKEQKVITKELRLQLAIVLKVQLFLKSKSFNNDKSWKYEVDRSALWFERLMASTPFRFFDGANNFRSLTPLP